MNAAPQVTNMMTDEPSWLTILDNFGLSNRARNRLAEDYVTANDLMASNVAQITSVINN